MATLLWCGCKEYKETKKWPDEQKQVTLKGLVELNTFGQNRTHNICRRLITRHFSQPILWVASTVILT